MFLSRNKKNNVYPCKPQFYYIKVGFKGVKILQVCFRDVNSARKQILLGSNENNLLFTSLRSEDLLMNKI